MSRLVLGNVTFEHFEIPEQLKGIGGIQQLAVHNFVGPNKTVQVLGPKPHDLSWTGTFTYEGAIDRVRKLDQYRISGEQIRLSWDVFAYLVIVKHFEASPHQEFEIPYELQLEVIEDLTGVPQKAKFATPDEGVLNAFNRADEALEALNGNSNFKSVPLPDDLLLPEDSTTITKYLKGAIKLQ